MLRQAYLVGFNAVSCVLWTFVLLATLKAAYDLHWKDGALYAEIGWSLALIQSLAIFEIIHAALGWVRAAVLTTAIQVVSRLFLVWPVLYAHPTVAHHPAFITMCFAWSLTEVVRYFMYAWSLVSSTSAPVFLIWLRYSMFMVLYPLGAGSEAILAYHVIPQVQHAHAAYAVALRWVLLFIVFAVYPPGLYVMYSHMLRQRRKVLGKTKTKKID